MIDFIINAFALYGVFTVLVTSYAVVTDEFMGIKAKPFFFSLSKIFGMISFILVIVKVVRIDL